GFYGDECNLNNFYRKKNNKHYTKLLKSIDGIVLETERYKLLLDNLEVSVCNDFLPKIQIDDGDTKCATDLLLKNGWTGDNFIVISFGAGNKHRIWPLERYIEIIDWLYNLNFTLVIVGSLDEIVLF